MNIYKAFKKADSRSLSIYQQSADWVGYYKDVDGIMRSHPLNGCLDWEEGNATLVFDFSVDQVLGKDWVVLYKEF